MEDHSATRPYDLCCTRGNETIFVEVKGTRGLGATVIVTRGEVEFARNAPVALLFIVSNVTVTKGKHPRVSGGEVTTINAWANEPSLSPIAFRLDLSAAPILAEKPQVKRAAG